MKCAQKKSWRKFAHAAGWPLLIMLPLETGCVHETHLTRTGSASDAGQWNQIQTGTPVDALRNKIGPPNSIQRFGDDAELWEYSYTVHRDTTDSLFLLYSGEDDEVHTPTAVFEIRGDAVAKISLKH